MPNDTPKPPRPYGGPLSRDGRRARHLAVVRDTWVAELAELVVLHPAGGRIKSPPAMIERVADRDPRSGSAPPSPA